jgi:molybdate transport system substrate-binding protein
MGLSRRRLLATLPLVAAAAQARADTMDLALICDTTLAPAVRRAAAAYRQQTGVQVFVFPTGPGLIMPQLEREVQNDIVVSQPAILARAASAGIVDTTTGAQWRNPLVIAGLQDARADGGTFAAPDPSAASDFDGPRLLARLGLDPANVLGAVDTDEVAFLITSGAAQAGLLHLTDVRADQRLAVIRTVPSEVHPPVLYVAAVNRFAGRPNPRGFVAFLAGKDGAAILTTAGLEVLT